MPQAYVDPEELEKFARNLKQFNAELRNSTSHLQGQFAKLGDVWRDQEHTRFAHEFQQTLGKLRSFMLTSDAFIPFLLGKAQKAREYFLGGPASKGDVLQQSGVNVYRVQGGHSQGRRSKERLQVTADGNINIQGTDALFLNFNQRERAFEF